jgi:hypothetical protein
LSGATNSNIFDIIDYNSVDLGWYMCREDVQKEINEILETAQNGETTYHLKYATTLKAGLLRRIVDNL